MTLSVISLATRGKICVAAQMETGLSSLDSPEITTTLEMKPEIQTVSGPAASAILPPQIISVEAEEDAAVTPDICATPEILTLQFTGSYPGSQTELKEDDTINVVGTTDYPATHIEVLDYEAGQAVLIDLGGKYTNFNVTVTIADRGDVSVFRPARCRAYNVAGEHGSSRDTNTGGGSTELVHLVRCNNLAPSFTDNGTTFPIGQTAFKGAETGSQDTTVSDYDTLVYSSPHGDFSIGSPTTYLQDKPIQCTNPGDYNDSVTNFRIVATRAANAVVSTFNKVIEVADVAPIITMVQPMARLQSGGNDGTSAPNHVITASSDQNLVAAPDVVLGVVGGGTWQGGGFAGGPKNWTRSLQVHDDDVKSSGAWTLSVPVANNAGLNATIAGTQVNGGFVARSVTFAPYSQTAFINVQPGDYSKIQADIFTATNQSAVRHTPQGDTADAVDEYTILVMGVSPATVFWNDLAAANGNSTGTAQLTDLEEAP